VASTYEPIASVNANGTSPYYFEFTSIPATYTDLVLVLYALEGGQDGLNMQVSVGGTWQTGNSYAITYLQVNAAGSTGSTTLAGSYLEIGVEGTTYAATLIHIQNYAATNMWKTFLSESTAPAFYTRMVTGTYTGTGAIDGIRLYNGGNSSHGVSSVATIFGIKEA
jgi:hypothetical protein